MRAACKTNALCQSLCQVVVSLNFFLQIGDELRRGGGATVLIQIDRLARHRLSRISVKPIFPARLNFRWVDRPGAGSPGRSRACPHQEDHGTKGRETAVASGSVLDGRDEPVPGFGKTLRNPRLRPGDEIPRVRADVASHPAPAGWETPGSREGREGSPSGERRSTLDDPDDAHPVAGTDWDEAASAAPLPTAVS